jgi:hypothetical protein
VWIRPYVNFNIHNKEYFRYVSYNNDQENHVWNQFFCFSASKWNNNVNRGEFETFIPF